ncbi:DUF1990 domain-containing protein [Pseudosporangium ferrugineum]|uniref:Uncharacterized protein (UPF0548 family) n=1 Tax=Pseudosporangium ferrugineum TaxID=439699 RepID=A0A2T0RQA5_9ACTN|nr:DUF1990 domain-containing protein [Pseudosporangium ferrugineum]PRY23358.1 uncharacterized protein (UPF0548 family) [Pseudosporangium ferrugineum]
MTAFTYAEVGATRHEPLPAGYRHLRYRTYVGGSEVFDRAAEAILTFGMHRATGATIRATAGRAAPGVGVTVGLGPLRVPCEVVWSADDRDRAGFGYGTLPGHQASGEEAFTVERDARGRVWFSVTAFSRPARPLMRLGGPFAVVAQHAYARICGRALKKLCASSRTVGP